MKVETVQILVQKGNFAESVAYKKILKEVLLAITSVVWHDEKKFIINPAIHGNGVNPIRDNFIKTLEELKWEGEHKMSLVDGSGPGPIDAIRNTKFGIFAVEWETGNISSSHRALNKIALGIIQKNLIGGFLIIPKRSLGKYLTDRIGNYEELEPYFPLYKKVSIKEGIIAVIAIDYDGTSIRAEIIKKGKDGNAKKYLKKSRKQLVQKVTSRQVDKKVKSK